MQPRAEIVLIQDLWNGIEGETTTVEAGKHALLEMAAKIAGLHPFQSTAQKIIQLTQKADCQVKELTEVIEKDPSLAVETLRFVHSAAFALRVRCTSIAQAVALLGSKPIGEMAMAWATLEIFASLEPQLIQLKEHAIMVAGLARHLAQNLNLPVDDVYTCGLMHDLGKLFLWQEGDENYVQLIKQNSQQPDTLHLMENRTYGYDHALLAAHILQAWGIPEPVPHVVGLHHQADPAHAAGHEIAQMVSLVRTADRLTYAIKQAESRDESIPELAQEACASYLQLTPEKLDEWWPELVLIVDEAELVIVNEKRSELFIPKEQSRQPSSPPHQSGSAITSEIESSLPLVEEAIPPISLKPRRPIPPQDDPPSSPPEEERKTQPRISSLPDTKYIVIGATGGFLLLIIVLLLLMMRS